MIIWAFKTKEKHRENVILKSRVKSNRREKKKQEAPPEEKSNDGLTVLDLAKYCRF